MKNLLIALTFVFLFISNNSFAKNDAYIINADELECLQYTDEFAMKVDSGIFSSIQKGYEIASKLTIDDVGKIATIVLFNNNKKMENIVKDVSDYVNQVNKAQQDLRKIKINKNTRIVVKRDK